MREGGRQKEAWRRKQAKLSHATPESKERRGLVGQRDAAGHSQLNKLKNIPTYIAVLPFEKSAYTGSSVGTGFLVAVEVTGWMPWTRCCPQRPR